MGGPRRIVIRSIQNAGGKGDNRIKLWKLQQLGLELCFCNSFGKERMFHLCICMKNKYGNDLFPVEVFGMWFGFNFIN